MRSVLLLSAILFCLVSFASKASDPPFWASSSISGDTLFFIQEGGQQRAAAFLLFVPKSMPELRSATGEVHYAPGTDFVWRPGSRRIELPAGSRIPFKRRADMYPAKDSPNSIPRASDRIGRSLLFGGGHFFHDLQIVASYKTQERWTGAIPRNKRKLLQKTIERCLISVVIR